MPRGPRGGQTIQTRSFDHLSFRDIEHKAVLPIKSNHPRHLAISPPGHLADDREIWSQKFPSNLSHTKRVFVILGLACDQGVKNVGGRSGPPMDQRHSGKLHRLACGSLSIPVYDLGDLPLARAMPPPPTSWPVRCSWIFGGRPHSARDRGGHDLAFPEAISLLDFLNGKPAAFLNIDAHLDLRDTSEGITSGSPWIFFGRERRVQGIEVANP